MAATLEVSPLTGSRPQDHEKQLIRARERLLARGFDALAVTTEEGSLGLELANQIGGIAIKPCQDLPEVLRASSRTDEEGRRIASVIPMQISGEDECLPFREEDGLSTLDAIRKSRSEPIARVDLPLSEGGNVAIAIVSSHNGENI